MEDSGTAVYGMGEMDYIFFLTLSFQAVAIEIVSGEISNSTHSEYLKDYSKKASSILCGCIFFCEDISLWNEKKSFLCLYNLQVWNVLMLVIH